MEREARAPVRAREGVGARRRPVRGPRRGDRSADGQQGARPVRRGEELEREVEEQRVEVEEQRIEVEIELVEVEVERQLVEVEVIRLEVEEQLVALEALTGAQVAEPDREANLDRDPALVVLVTNTSSACVRNTVRGNVIARQATEEVV